jgi:hypothetical protein
MIFHLRADATFDAESIDDAFIKLANHFLSLRLGKEDTGLEQSGSIKIQRDPSYGVASPTEVVAAIRRAGELDEIRQLLTAARAVVEAEKRAIFAVPYKVFEAISGLREKLKPFQGVI